MGIGLGLGTVFLLGNLTGPGPEVKSGMVWLLVWITI
jgi:hypothetical protein